MTEDSLFDKFTKTPEVYKEEILSNLEDILVEERVKILNEARERDLSWRMRCQRIREMASQLRA